MAHVLLFKIRFVPDLSKGLFTRCRTRILRLPFLPMRRWTGHPSQDFSNRQDIEMVFPDSFQSCLLSGSPGRSSLQGVVRILHLPALRQRFLPPHPVRGAFGSNARPRVREQSAYADGVVIVK